MDCFQLSNQPLALGPSDQSPSVTASGTVGGGELGPRWQGSGRVGVRRDGRVPSTDRKALPMRGPQRKSQRRSRSWFLQPQRASKEWTHPANLDTV